MGRFELACLNPPPTRRPRESQVVEIGQWISGVLGRKAFARAGNAVAAKKAALAA